MRWWVYGKPPYTAQAWPQGALRQVVCVGLGVWRPLPALTQSVLPRQGQHRARGHGEALLL